MIKNKKVCLMMAVMLVISFSAQAMHEGLGFDRTTTSYNNSHLEEKLQEGARQSTSLQTNNETRTHNRLATTVVLPVHASESVIIKTTNKPVDVVNPLDSERSLTDQQTALLKEKQHQKTFTIGSSAEDVQSERAQRQEALAKLQEELKKLEEKQQEVGAVDTNISERIQKLDDRITNLSEKIIKPSVAQVEKDSPVVLPKKQGFLAKLFGRKGSSTATGEQTGAPKKIKVGFFDGLALKTVLKDSKVIKAMKELPNQDYLTAKDIVTSVVVQMRAGKNIPAPALILEKVLSMIPETDRSTITLEDEEKYKQVVTDVYDALVLKKKINKVNGSSTEYANQIEKFKVKLSEEVYKDFLNDSDLEKIEKIHPSKASQGVVNSIIQAFRNGKSPVVEEKEKWGSYSTSNEFPEDAYRNLADAILKNLLNRNGVLTSEVQTKIAQEQAADLSALQKEKQELLLKKQELADENEAGLLDKKKYEDKKVQIEKELEEIAARQASEETAQNALQSALAQLREEEAKKQAEEEARQLEQLEQQRQTALQLEEQKKAEAQELKPKLQEANAAAQAEQTAIVEIKESNDSDPKKLLELVQNAQEDTQKVEILEQEETAAQEVADQAEAEAAKLKAKINKQKKNKKLVSINDFVPVRVGLVRQQLPGDGGKPEITVADNSAQVAAKEKTLGSGNPDLVQRELGSLRVVGDKDAEDAFVNKFITDLNNEASLKKLIVLMPQNIQATMIRTIVTELHQGKSPVALFNAKSVEGTFFENKTTQVTDADGIVKNITLSDEKLIKTYKKLVADIWMMMDRPETNLLPKDSGEPYKNRVEAYAMEKGLGEVETELLYDVFKTVTPKGIFSAEKVTSTLDSFEPVISLVMTPKFISAFVKTHKIIVSESNPERFQQNLKILVENSSLVPSLTQEEKAVWGEIIKNQQYSLKVFKTAIDEQKKSEMALDSAPQAVQPIVNSSSGEKNQITNKLNQFSQRLKNAANAAADAVKEKGRKLVTKVNGQLQNTSDYLKSKSTN